MRKLAAGVVVGVLAWAAALGPSGAADDPARALTWVVFRALGNSTAAHVSFGMRVDGLGEIGGLPRSLLPPASTQKLYTGATALAVLGPSTRLRTEVRATGPLLPDGTLAGDLVLAGGGDPTLVGDDLQRLAFALANRGVRAAAGSLVGDVSRYDRATAAPGWKPGWVGDEVGPLSALMVDRNTYRRDAAFLADPTPGNLDRFRVALARAGIRVDGANVVAGGPVAGTVLASHDSPTVAEIVSVMLKLSVNTHAEMLLKELGRTIGQPTTSGGIEVVWRTAEAFGMGRGQSADGSGLSSHDRAAPLHVADWLTNVVRSPIGEMFRTSLPLACGDGTLQQRFCATPAAGNVFAKTGTLAGVTTLAGYTTTASGRQVRFSFELAGVADPAAARAAIDRAVVAIVTFGG